MKRPGVIGGVASGATVPDKGALLDGLPTVWAMLTDDLWDDGTPRVRATMLVIADGAVVKLWLNDKENGRSCWVSGESLEHALNALEDALYGGSAAWRLSSPPKPKKTK
jgi:hypothetical protein